MLKLLIHKQLSEIFRAYLYDAKKNKTRSKGATAAYIVLFVLIMAGMLGGMFTYLSLSICEPLSAAGMDWLYFALMGLIAILLGSFGSVFNTYSGLYLAKDNDLLLSMPIPGRCYHDGAASRCVYYGTSVFGSCHNSSRRGLSDKNFRGCRVRDRLVHVRPSDLGVCSNAVVHPRMGSG